MARIWKCPNCGKGLRAPEQMSSGDVRRYCRDCSWTTGQLVRRERVGADKRRAKGKAKAVATRQRNAAKRERERIAREVVEAKDGWRINAVQQTFKWCERLKPLERASLYEVQLRRRSDGSYSGHCWNYGRIVLSVGINPNPATVYMLIVHELAHLVARDNHGIQFKKTIVSIARAAFPGIELERAKRGESYYALDNRIDQAIHDHLQADGRIRWHVEEKGK